MSVKKHSRVCYYLSKKGKAYTYTYTFAFKKKLEDEQYNLKISLCRGRKEQVEEMRLEVDFSE